MMSFSSSNKAHFFAAKGFSFEGHFRYGAVGIIARQDAPKLRFPGSMPLESVRDTIDLWNALLVDLCPGTGYYAFSQADEMATADHILVLFSDEDFCKAFLGVVDSENLPPLLDGMVQRQFRG